MQGKETAKAIEGIEEFKKFQEEGLQYFGVDQGKDSNK